MDQDKYVKEVNDFATALVNQRYEEGRTKFLDLLLLLIKDFEERRSKTDQFKNSEYMDFEEYHVIEFLFFQFNKSTKDLPWKREDDLSSMYPLNSLLLIHFENPNDLLSIIFQMYETLSLSPSEHSLIEIKNAIKDYSEGKKVKLLPHRFEFDHRDAKGTSVVRVYVGEEDNETTHILTY